VASFTHAQLLDILNDLSGEKSFASNMNEAELKIKNVVKLMKELNSTLSFYNEQIATLHDDEARLSTYSKAVKKLKAIDMLLHGKIQNETKLKVKALEGQIDKCSEKVRILNADIAEVEENLKAVKAKRDQEKDQNKEYQERFEALLEMKMKEVDRSSKLEVKVVNKKVLLQEKKKCREEELKKIETLEAEIKTQENELELITARLKQAEKNFLDLSLERKPLDEALTTYFSLQGQTFHDPRERSAWISKEKKNLQSAILDRVQKLNELLNVEGRRTSDQRELEKKKQDLALNKLELSNMKKEATSNVASLQQQLTGFNFELNCLSRKKMEAQSNVMKDSDLFNKARLEILKNPLVKQNFLGMESINEILTSTKGMSFQRTMRYVQYIYIRLSLFQKTLTSCVLLSFLAPWNQFISRL
jgi:chromosome segregation ATPase